MSFNFQLKLQASQLSVQANSSESKCGIATGLHNCNLICTKVPKLQTLNIHIQLQSLLRKHHVEACCMTDIIKYICTIDFFKKFPLFELLKVSYLILNIGSDCNNEIDSDESRRTLFHPLLVESYS